MKRAIITGVSGQDGSYLSQLLISKGYFVLGLVRSYSDNSLYGLKYLGISNSVQILECDLMDISQIISVLNEYFPDEIFNLSAQSSVSTSFKQPIGTIHYNTMSVLNILEAIRITDNKIKFYQASSSEMFGRVKSLPITLNSQMHPVSPYAISKATAYWSCINYRESYGLYVSNGILFNHESYLRSSNFFVKKVIRESIKISKGVADKLKVGDLDIKRDFGYAPKYVEAMWLALQQDKPLDYMICSGTSISLRAIVYYVFDKLGISKDKLLIDKQFVRPNEIKDIYGDNSMAKKHLDWQYDYSFFDVLDMLIDEELYNYKY